MKKIIFLLMTLALSACSAAGALYQQATPNKDTAKIVVYRPDLFMGSGGYYEVDINGNAACKLNNAGYFIASKKAGTITISSSIWNQPGTSKVNIKTNNGQIYYVRMQMDAGKQIAGGSGGMAGSLLAEGISSTGGPFIFTIVEPKEAQEELKALHMDSDCQK